MSAIVRESLHLFDNVKMFRVQFLALDSFGKQKHLYLIALLQGEYAQPKRVPYGLESVEYTIMPIFIIYSFLFQSSFYPLELPNWPVLSRTRVQAFMASTPVSISR